MVSLLGHYPFLRIPQYLVFSFSFSMIAAADAWAGGPAEYVIQISVDGCGSTYLQSLINENQLPNFNRFQTEGSWTNNARTNFDYTVTLPNHTCMVTGRPVMDKRGSSASITGHHWTNNGEPGSETLHSNLHAYVKSTFDVAHDNGLSTALYATKTKFVVYDQSYNAAAGAPDTVGEDNGRDKIDVVVIDENPLIMAAQFVLNTNSKPANYNFVHFRNPDSAGHAIGWGSPEYFAALKQVDGYLGSIFELVTTHEMLKGKTSIILSADHGGFGRDHSNNSDPLDYTIPFYTWGAGVAKAKDLYKLNAKTREDPGTSRIDYSATEPQPIRNGDGGNLALRLLSLGAIPDSLINAAQDLATDVPASETAAAK